MITLVETQSFNDVLCEQAARYTNRTALTFLSGDGSIEAEWTFKELDRRARAVGRLLEAHGARGQRVLLLFPPGLDYLSAFFGALYAGAVAVPAYPPRYNQRLERLRAIAADAQAKFAITVPQVFSRINASLGHAPEMKSLQWLTVDDDQLRMDQSWEPVEISADDLAFLQYTSGSTAQPRGVMVTHGNLLHNEQMIQQAFEQTEEDVVVSWLPPYHDMGLIGTILQPLFTGSRAVLMSPVSFLQRPVMWLETISRYGATTSGGPNFGYELCINKVTEEQRADLDLSTWRVAFNGSEPVRAATFDRFANAFAACGFRREAFQPCYGLAEATLLVSGARRYFVPTIKQFDAQKLESQRMAAPAREDETAKSLVGCGAGASEQKIVIVDPETSTRCAPGGVGEVWISGPSVTRGYWNRPDETERTFNARLKDEVDGPFMRTGDLGFFCNGELFITGRLKDLIIVRGRNLYPHDIEETVRQCHPALASGGAAVFAIDAQELDEEKLIVVQEIKPRAGLNLETVIDRIRQAIAMHHEVEVHDVLLTGAKALPKTSSGKIQRYLCRSKYLNDEFKVIARWAGEAYPEQSSLQPAAVDLSNVEAITEWLVQQLAACLRLDARQIDPEKPVSHYGIDSLRATELTHTVQTTLGVELPLTTLLEGPPPAEIARLLFAKIAAAPRASQPVAGSNNTGPLSSGQRALWFMQQLAPSSAAYNLAGAIVVREAVDIAALRHAFQAVTHAHAILRTTFTDKVEQHVSARAECSFDVRDATSMDDSELREEMAAEAQRPFDLRREHALRALLYQRGPGEDVLLLVVHHIAVDLWSLGIVIRDIGQAYQAAKTGKPAKIEAPELRYLDYVQWQNEFLSGVEAEQHWAYWQNQLSGELPIVDLPTVGPRPPVKTFAGAVKVVSLDAELTQSLKKLAEANNATLFTTLLAAFHALLYRYTGQDELITGATTSGRSHANFSGVVGYFVNPLVIRSRVEGKQSFNAFLAIMKATVLEALAHKEFPFPVLVERLQPERNAGRSPLFDVAFGFQNAPASSASGVVALAVGQAGVTIDLNGMPVETLAVERRAAQFDLTLMMAEVEDALTAAFEYNTDLFDAATIDKISNHFQNLLTAIVRTPAEPLARLPLLDEDEVQQQVIAWNATAADYPSELCLHELFEASAARTPDAIAVSCDNEALTYAEVNQRADSVAAYLRSRGVGCEDRVALLMERSPQLVVAILAILKSGAAYVPLDPTYPPQRLEWMIGDSGAKLLLSQSSVGVALRGHPSMANGGAATECRPYRINTQVSRSGHTAENAAYVIYTSGSTGVPKAAIITHAAAVNYICWAREQYVRNDQISFPLFTSLAFDLTVTSIFTPLISGNTIVIYESDGDTALNQIIADDRVGVLKLTPGHLALLKERDNRASGIARLIVGGEALTVSLAQSAQDSFGDHVEIINEYGPTEATVGCMIHTFDAANDRRQTVPIGMPAGNTQIYLFDEDLNAVPEGVAGELFIGGAGLARGYLNRPHVTAERFVPHPCSQTAGARLYRTGDLGRRLASGGIEFISRKDHQVKVRGYRIELAEVETALTSHPQIKEAFVFVKGVGARKRLVACVMPAASAEEVKQYLSERLPEYMIPTQIVSVSQVPLTTNGKVDRKALEKLLDQQEAETLEQSRPATPVEEMLAQICSEILGTREVRIEQNFFELGGHSLLAAQLVSRVREVFGVELALRTIFEHPTIAAIARVVETALRERGNMSSRHIIPVKREGAVPLSFAQERLWFLNQLEPGSAAYNVPCKARFKGTLDVGILERTLTEILRRHESLRTAFTTIDGKVTQVISPPAPLTLQIVDLSTFDQTEREAQTDFVTREEAATPFNFSDGPPVRIRLVRLSDDDHVLLVTMHHMLCDEWSLEILIKEIATLYSTFVLQQGSPLPELPIQYPDYTVWQRNYLQGDVLAKELGYWKKELEGAPPALELPFDRPRSNAKAPVAGYTKFELPAAVTPELKSLCRQEGASFFMILLAAFNVLLYRYTGQKDIVVGTPSSGRSRLETERVIGFFVNTLVLRTKLSGATTFRELLREIRENALSAYTHNELPFEKVVEEVNPTRSLSHSPLFQVMFIMENALRETSITLPGATMIASGSSAPTAKFDLTLSMGESGGQLGGLFEYNTDLFDASTIDKISRHFQNLVHAIVRAPDEPLARLSLLDEHEVRQQLIEWNATTGDRGPEFCLHQFVEASVGRTPDATAVVCDGEQITYGELNARANELSERLRALGVGAEERVGVCVERSIEMIVSVLAVLKSGGAYVPLDPEYPRERLAFMLQDSQPRVLLTQERLVEVLPEYDCHVVFPSAATRNLAPVGAALRGRPSAPTSDGGAATECRPYRTPNPRSIPDVKGENLAYVIYTSGSTGRPKGVCIEHRQAATLINWAREEYSASELSAVLASTSLCFDLSIFELFVTLSAGGTVVLAANALSLAESHGAEQVSLINTVPSAIRELLRLDAVPQSVQVVNLAGEALPAPLVEELYAQPQIGAVYNLYGPSEDTTYSTGALMKRAAGAKVTIGRALQHKQVHVFGEGMELLPVGVTGEVCVAGTGVARGYLNAAAMTAERFVPHPYSTERGARLYRTGDLGRWLASGEVEFLGRRDQQVKLRGYRIELGEIEAALQSHAQVREAVVIVKEDERGEKRLVAYVVPDGEVTASAVTQYVSERLPAYMVPSQVVSVVELPLTANGKVDRQALARMDVAREQQTEQSARTPVEEVLCGIWSETLGLKEVGVRENFFDLGGHSLLATQIVSRVREVFDVELELRMIFQYPTIEGLATVIEQLQLETSDDGESLSRILAEIKDLSEDEAAAVFVEEQPFLMGVTNEQSL